MIDRCRYLTYMEGETLMKKMMLFLVSLGLFTAACQPCQPHDCICPTCSTPSEAAPAATEQAEAAAPTPTQAEAPVPQTAQTPIPVGEAEIALPKPLPVKATLTECLQNRRSIRSYTDQMISLEQLSGLLWSANGVNRDDGKRTAPSARNKQSVSLFVAFEKAAYRYDHVSHKLLRASEDDLRPVKAAPIELIVTSSFADNALIQGIDTGVVSENAALYCAAEGLATVIRMMRGDQSELQKALGLEPDNLPIFNMAIGYGAE